MHSVAISHTVPLTPKDYKNGYAYDSLQSPTWTISFAQKLCQLITLKPAFSNARA